MAKLERIAMNHRGAYQSDAQYTMLDAVYYLGSTYVYVDKTPGTGVLPTDTGSWELMAAKGATGDGAGDMLMSIYDKNQDGVVDAATKLSTSRKIGSADFDGSASITLAQMGATDASNINAGTLDIARYTPGSSIMIPAAISEGTNLNNHLDMGHYRARVTVLANSITNKPSDVTGWSSGFALDVYHTRTDGLNDRHVTQVMTSGDDRYIRTAIISGGVATWGAWAMIQTGAERTLWTGTWTSGSISVPAHVWYRTLRLYVLYASMTFVVEMPKSGSVSRGSVVRLVGSSMRTVTADVTISGDTLTLGTLATMIHNANSNNGDIVTTGLSVTRIDAG